MPRVSRSSFPQLWDSCIVGYITPAAIVISCQLGTYSPPNWRSSYYPWPLPCGISTFPTVFSAASLNPEAETPQLSQSFNKLDTLRSPQLGAARPRILLDLVLTSRNRLLG